MKFSLRMAGVLQIASRRFVRAEEGLVAVFFALTLPVMLMAGGLAIDLGLSLSERNSMQGAADAAARAAAQIKALNNSTDSMVSNEAHALASANGYADGVEGVSVTVNVPPKYGYFTNYPNAVEVLIAKPNSFFFANLFGMGAGSIQVRAVGDWDFAPCIAALNPASNGQTGIEIGGTGTVLNAPCGVYSNSANPTASIAVNGGATLSTNLAAMVGGTKSTIDCLLGPSCAVGNQKPYADPLADVDLSVPSKVSAGTATAKPSNTPLTISKKGVIGGLPPGSSKIVLTPGNYPDGLTISTSVPVVMSASGASSTYYFGGDGLSVSGAVDATAGVTVVVSDTTKGSFSVTGSNSSFNINPPAQGNLAGISIASRSTVTSKQGFVSGASGNINGVVYVPNWWWGMYGGVTGGDNCLTVIASSLSFNGGGNIGRGCPSVQMNASAYRGARLVE